MATEKVRFNMRIPADVMSDIKDAAEITGTDLTSFFISAASARARKVLLGNGVIRLTQDEAEAIAEALDREAIEKPSLQKAFAKLRRLEAEGKVSG